jgi:uncharacterized Tic20 family protein
MTEPPMGPPPSTGPANQPNNDDRRTMAQVAHFGLIIGVLPSLVIYLVKGEDPWVKAEAAKAFNFGLGLNVLIIFFWIGRFAFSLGDNIIATTLSCGLCLFGLAGTLAMGILGILNGIRITNGEETSYPFEIPILK